MTVQHPMPPQDLYRGVNIRQTPANDVRNVASNQQYHGDTFRRPSTNSEAQSPRESPHETSPAFTPYHHRESNLDMLS
jgi:hypothetical protein